MFDFNPAFISAPVALPLRKNPGPGWSRDVFICFTPWGEGSPKSAKLSKCLLWATMFYSSLQLAIVNSSYSNINLKPKQVNCLEAVYSSKAVIAVLPTGYGKSLIFQILPSLLCDKFVGEAQRKRPSITTVNKPVILVVSPLNALIKNQIKRSCQGTIKAGVLNVKKSKDTGSLQLDFSGNESLLKNAKYDIVYLHPKSLLSCEEGMELLQNKPYQESVRAIIVDEAHCILEW